MIVPAIAIVGRPNVGKSSYLNACVGRRVSIVEATPGVTRDRISIEVNVDGRPVELIDTGGIGVVDEARLDEHIERQIEEALQNADSIVFLVDGREGITVLDEKVAQILRRLEKPVFLGVNKIDHPKHNDVVLDFYSLGLGDPMPVSAREKMGVFELLEHALSAVPETGAPVEEMNPSGDLPKFCFVGKRNVGKSTLLNALAGEERVIVSEIAGTTRDAVDVVMDVDGRRFVGIDTAGMMRKKKISDSIQFYSQVRSAEAISRSDVVLLLIDSTLDISRVDKKIEQVVLDERKACVLVINKWDLARESMDTDAYMEYLSERLPGLHFAPVVFMSALEGMNVSNAIDVAFDVVGQATTKVSTSELNKVLGEAFARRKPGGPKGYKAKIFYGTQVASSPPIFVVFVNDPKMFPENYGRFVENRLRDAFDFQEIPVRVKFKRRVSLFHD